MSAVLEGWLLVDGALVAGRLRLEAERIAAVEVDATLARDDLPVIAPGLVDLHVHGYGGADPLVELGGMARRLAERGTTAFQPTLFPAAPERLGEHAQAVWRAAGALDDPAAARVLGLHLEGPFVNPNEAGALPPDELAEPSPAALRAILGPATGDGRGIRTVTLAPELPGALDLVRELATAGVRVSLGHSRARLDEARAAARAGAVGATHLFNAMSGFHHRAPGLVGFALSDDAVCAELIGDLVHVGPEAVALALKARGPEGLALISDALPGAGSGCDVFHAFGRRHHVDQGAVWFEDPETGERHLAGAAACQLEALRRLVEAGVVDLADGLRMASETPARALGLEGELGRLAIGARADLIALARPGLELVAVWIGGLRRKEVPGSADRDR